MLFLRFLNTLLDMLHVSEVPWSTWYMNMNLV